MQCACVQTKEVQRCDQEDILDCLSLDVRVAVIRNIKVGRVTYSQLQSYNDFADVNQNYICTVLVVNNMKNGLYISVEVIKQ